MVDVFARDSLRSQVEIASGGRNTVLYDSYGNPHVMVIVPRFTHEDVGGPGTGWCSAFMADGTEIPEIFVGQYQAGVAGDSWVTLPNMTPWYGNRNDARSRAAVLGPGWHLMSAHEWAAIALWCIENAYEPRGNTDVAGVGGFEGWAPAEPHERGRFARQLGGDTRLVRTGTGPDTWRHDGTPHGIADLAGNGGQILEGVELRDGRWWAVPDNRFWDLAGEMEAQDAYIDAVAGAPVFDAAVTNTWPALTAANWQAVATAGGYVSNELLANLLIEPSAADPAGYTVMSNIAGTMVVVRGRYGLGSLEAFIDPATGSSAHRSARLAFCG